MANPFISLSLDEDYDKFAAIRTHHTNECQHMCRQCEKHFCGEEGCGEQGDGYICLETGLCFRWSDNIHWQLEGCLGEAILHVCNGTSDQLEGLGPIGQALSLLLEQVDVKETDIEPMIQDARNKGVII